jgi:hypothetical protein
MVYTKSISNNALLLLIIGLILIYQATVYAEQDRFEPDNSKESANVIYLTNPDDPNNEHVKPQLHNFYSEDDQDWIKVFAVKDQTYKITVEPLKNMKCNPMIELYADDGQTLLDSVDHYFSGKEENLSWDSEYNGVYYINIRQCDPLYDETCKPVYGELSHYSVICSKPYAGAGFGYVYAQMMPCTQITKNLLAKTFYNNKQYGEAECLPECNFFMTHEAGTWDFVIYAFDKLLFKTSITVKEFDVLNIPINHPCDTNKNGFFDLSDTINIFKKIAEKQ